MDLSVHGDFKQLMVDSLQDCALVVLDTDGKVLYSQLVPEIAEEPDYEAAIAALG